MMKNASTAIKERYQNDLFSDHQFEQKGRKFQYLSRYKKQRILPHVRVPVENAVIMAIGVLVLMIISFAIGVERGKNTVRIPVRPVEREEIVSVRRVEPAEMVQAVPRPVVAPEIVPEEPISAYIVQLASFRDEKHARNEVANLKKRNVNAWHSRKGSWYQVYAVGFQTKKAAMEAQRELEEIYVDCYVNRGNNR
jgi:cell division septation protein DedD